MSYGDTFVSKSPQDTFTDEAGEIPNAWSPNKAQQIEQLCNRKEALEFRTWISSNLFSHPLVSTILHRMTKIDWLQTTFVVHWL